jgi:hypothetical protein
LSPQSTNNWTAPVAAQAIFLDSEKLTRQGWDFSRSVKEACFPHVATWESGRDGRRWCDADDQKYNEHKK